MRALRNRAAGMKRMWWPMESSALPSRDASTMLRASAAFIAMGFSHSTWTPLRNAITVGSQCA